MRSLITWSLWLLLVLPVLAQGQSEPGPALPPSDPDQALPAAGPLIAEVLRTHPGVRKAELEVEAARAELAGAGLQPNPTLTLSATAGEAAEDSNALRQPRLRRQQAQAQLEAALLQLRAVRRQIANQVCRDWLNLWESQHLAMMAQLRLSLMNDMVKVSNRRYEVGEIPQNESLRVELAAAEAEADWKKAEANYLAAQRSLWLLRGQGGPLPDAEPPPPFHDHAAIFHGPTLSSRETPWTLEEVLAAAESHPEVDALRRQQQAAVLAAQLVAKERAPQLGFSLYRSQLFSNSVEQGAQLSVSWPLFDWGSLKARRQAQEAQALARLAEAEEKVLLLRREVSELWNQWQGARAVRQILEVQAQRYEELAREARIGYDLGLLTLTDVLQTETAFREAGVQLIEAQAQVYRMELGLLERTNLAWPEELLEE
jgi:outer membrane protein TolC